MKKVYTLYLHLLNLNIDDHLLESNNYMTKKRYDLFDILGYPSFYNAYYILQSSLKWCKDINQTVYFDLLFILQMIQ